MKVYWPGQYEAVVQYLQKKSTSGTAPGKPVFNSNMEVIAFAACVGLSESHPLQTEGTQEISTFTFEGKGYGPLLFLIPMLAAPEKFDLYKLRDGEGERDCLKEFERYAAGGLQILHEKYSRAGLVPSEHFLATILEQYVTRTGSDESRVRDADEQELSGHKGIFDIF
jgi:dnd system-associated protein 4